MKWAEIQRARNALKVGDVVLLPVEYSICGLWGLKWGKWSKILYLEHAVERITLKTVVIAGKTYMKSTGRRRGKGGCDSSPSFAVVGEKKSATLEEIVEVGAERDLRRSICDLSNEIERSSCITNFALKDDGVGLKDLEKLAALLEEVKLICIGKVIGD